MSTLPEQEEICEEVVCPQTSASLQIQKAGSGPALQIGHVLFCCIGPLQVEHGNKVFTKLAQAYELYFGMNGNQDKPRGSHVVRGTGRLNLTGSVLGDCPSPPFTIPPITQSPNHVNNWYFSMVDISGFKKISRYSIINYSSSTP